MRTAPARVRSAQPSQTSEGVLVEWSLEPGDLAAVPRIRHRIMDALRQDAPRDADLWSAELVVAELLSNAVTHTAGPAFVSLQWDGDHPRLQVADTGPGFTGSPSSAGSPSDIDAAGDGWTTSWPALPADPLAEGGRGLYLVSRLALDVKVAAGRHGGSQVSVTLDVGRPG